VKLIKQVRLEYRQGTSDKVYEVDLCEVGADQFVVNFRYGRRGTALRDGSKTPAPVSQAKAASIFDSLVASKRREGYVNAGTASPPGAGRPAPDVTPPPSPPTPVTPPAPPRRRPMHGGPLRHVRLELHRGKSDKAFEIDLSEVGGGLFQVTSRYGRCTGGLRPGTATVAMPRDEADDIYDNLVAAKVREGYVDVTAGAPAPVAASPPPVEAPRAVDAEARQQAVLNRLREGYGEPAPEKEAGFGFRKALDRLREGFTGKGEGKARRKKPWRLSRAIWRAGELGLDEAEPLLLDLLAQTQQMKAQAGTQRKTIDEAEVKRLLGARSLRLPSTRWGWTRWSETFVPPEDMYLYCLAWALGRCGSAASVPALQELRTEPWAPIGRIATAALLLLLDGAERDTLIEQLIVLLPEALGRLCRSGPAEAFQLELTGYLETPQVQPDLVLDHLYLIDNPHVRPALLQVLRTVPLQSAYFQPLRHIFKIAGLRRDAEVFGILAHRFETTVRGAASHRVDVAVTHYANNRLTPNRIHISPFTEQTQRYFRQRIWRTLRRLGAEGDRDYVRLAGGFLLPFTDADLQRSRSEFRHYWSFTHILYRHSTDYQADWRKAIFVQRRSSRSREATTQRSEAFPKLWEAAPEILLRLLEGSRCEVVHQFAVNILRDCPDFCRQLAVSVLIRLLAAPYEVTMELGLELAIQRSDPDPPENELVLALANCRLARAREQAYEWIDALRHRFTEDLYFLARLAASPQAETRTFARELLRGIAFTQPAAEALIGQLITLLRTFGAEEGERARETTVTLQVVFATPLRKIGEAVIRDLLEHPLAEVRQFAGEILLAHDTLGRRPPEDILLRLLKDPAAAVRGVGVRLLGQLPEETLTQSLDLLVGLSRHELVDFRENIRPVVKRLADADRAFGRRIAERFVEALLVPGAPEGVPSHTARLLREDLRQHLDTIPPATIWKLLQARSPVAQEVGGMLLATNIRPEDLALGEIVKLASHDILSVREAAWQMCRSSLPRLKQDMDTATRLVDARWEDSRQFGFGLLRDAFNRGELTPGVLVSLCDSVRPDVQQFGREMITRLFEEADGPEYAIKLSEHPSASMQMFAANFLERYAGDNPERLRQLSFYFQSVLSRVNQGRIAKERVFRFLQKVAAAGEESARVVAEVLARQSATVSIRDRARAVEILTDIHARYPGIDLPLQVRPVEVRHGV
jgi:predicted DNA-binding WGR domain protein